MTDAASVIRYVEDGERVLAEVSGYDMPHQSDWVSIEGTEYKVFDVVHTVFPDHERMVSTVFVWEPDPEASDGHLDALHQQAVAARAGDGLDVQPPTHGTTGEPVELVRNDEVLATVTASASPNSQTSTHEGVHIVGHDGIFTVTLTAHSVTDSEQRARWYLYEMDSPKAVGVRRTLQGQRKKARERVLDEDGPDAYEALMERVQSQENST